MTTTSHPAGACPKCGAAVPPEAPEGLCPKCVLAAAAAPEPGPTSTAQIPALDAIAAAFPQLEIIEMIGRGAMGFVYKGRQARLDRFVALKLLPQSLARDPQFAERFNREGRVLARLSHPNIVAVYDFGQTEGFYYLMMEYVDGVNLREAMQAGRFSPQEALSVVPKICEALQYAHDHGVLHRDIKPENILLDSKGRVKIADFGIAKLVGEDSAGVTLTATGSAIGTPHYMAPEQIEKPSTVDHRADIYSLGVVFYEMLTGELPLGRFKPPSARAPLDDRIDEIVLRALARERELRQQTANEVRREVETVAATPHSSSARPSHRSRRALIVAVAFVGAGALLLHLLGLQLLPLAAGIAFPEIVALAAAWLVWIAITRLRKSEFTPMQSRRVLAGLAALATIGAMAYIWVNLRQDIESQTVASAAPTNQQDVVARNAASLPRKLLLKIPTIENDQYRNLSVTTDSALPSGYYLEALLTRPDGQVVPQSSVAWVRTGPRAQGIMRHLLWSMTMFSSNEVRGISEKMRATLDGRVVEVKDGLLLEVFRSATSQGSDVIGWLAMRHRTNSAQPLPPITISFQQKPQIWPFFISSPVSVSTPAGYLPNATVILNGDSLLEASLSTRGANGDWSGDSCQWYYPRDFERASLEEIARQIDDLRTNSAGRVTLRGVGSRYRVFSVTNESGATLEGFFEWPAARNDG